MQPLYPKCVVLIVRHGARADRQGLGSGRSWTENCEASHSHDAPLTEEGEAQALRTGALAARICQHIGAKAAHIFSSPLRRCVQTSRGIRCAIASATEHAAVRPVQVVPQLYELMTSELFPTKPPFVLSPTLVDDPSVVLWDADAGAVLLSQWPETKAQSTARTLSAVTQLLDRHVGSAEVPSLVVFVAHQFSCRVATSLLLTKMAAAATCAWVGDTAAKYCDWRKQGRSLMSVSRERRCGFCRTSEEGQGQCPLTEDESFSTDFGLCSVTAFSWEGPVAFAESCPGTTLGPSAVWFVGRTGHLGD